VLLPRQQAKLAGGTKDKEHAMSQTPNTAIAVIGIDIGKNSFHVVGHDARVHAGQNAKYSVRADVFCSASKLRHCSTQPALRILPMGDITGLPETKKAAN
jgi:hypothetical protein